MSNFEDNSKQSSNCVSIFVCNNFGQNSEQKNSCSNVVFSFVMVEKTTNKATIVLKVLIVQTLDLGVNKRMIVKVHVTTLDQMEAIISSISALPNLNVKMLVREVNKPTFVLVVHASTLEPIIGTCVFIMHPAPIVEPIVE